jgi:cytoskeletal protein CcmA (bactofilin family)
MNLFGRVSRSREPEHIETIIGPSADLRGSLRSDGGVRIDGAFEGVVETAGNVVVGETARVVADITGRNVTVAGAVKGNVTASGRLEILSTGLVVGDIAVQTVMIDDGGQFHGVSRMRTLDHPALAAPPDHVPSPVPASNGAASKQTSESTVDVTARRRTPDPEPEPAEPVAVVEVGDDFELDLDDLDLDMDIDPIIPDSEPEAPRRNGGARPSSRR